jgi:DNA repair protein RadC
MPSGMLRGQSGLTPLQERFVKSGFEALNDQEAIELLLCLVLSRRDCRKLAKGCIEHFKNLRRFLTASSQELEQVGLTPPCMFCVKLLHDLPAEVLKEEITGQPIYKSSKEVFDYLSYSMRDLEREVFRVIYLNSQNQVIDAVDLFEGTLESIPIRPREIVESAIKYNATALVVAHNHPSGDPTPSKSDKQLTRDLVFIGMILPIRVLDHIIIGENRCFSFADAGLIQKYEDEFLNLKIRGLFDTVGDYSEPAAKVYTITSNQ